MSNQPRTDEHRPSAIIPADYEYVTIGPVQGAPLASRVNFERIERDMARTGGHWATHNHGGNCHVCGSVNLIWWICYRNIRTNEYIKVGEECAYNIDASGSGVRALNLFRKAARLEIGVAKGKAKAQAVLAEAGLSRAWEISENYFVKQGEQQLFEETTIQDIVRKLVKYGSISVNQGEFIRKLIARIDNRAQFATKRAEENAKAEPFPITSTRIEIIGTIVSTKVQESDFGSVFKMLVKADAGWKIWATCPGSPAKGDRVRFFAKVQPSRDDDRFGFGSRPTKFEIIQAAPAAA